MTATQQDILVLRSLKKTAIIILLLMKYGKPLTAKQAAILLEIDEGTASKYMQSLQAIGLIDHLGRFKGYTLTQNAIQLTMPLGDKTGDSPVFPTTTVINIDNNKVIKDIKTEAVEQKRENPAFEENKKMLRACGIGEPSLSKLADMEHVNKSYLEAMITSWKMSEKGVGLLIHRIRNADPEPKITTISKGFFGRNRTPERMEENRKKYTSGEHSDFVEH
jgi:hypothetical protein